MLSYRFCRFHSMDFCVYWNHGTRIPLITAPISSNANLLFSHENHFGRGSGFSDFRTAFSNFTFSIILSFSSCVSIYTPSLLGYFKKIGLDLIGVLLSDFRQFRLAVMDIMQLLTNALPNIIRKH